MKTAELDAWLGGLPLAAKTKNGLRHSYISYRLAILHDTARVALEAGNSPEVIFTSYRELVTPEAASAWFGVEPV